MKTHIETLILRQHTNLSANLNYREGAGISLCDLQHVNFNAGGSPNYTNPGQRSLYLLRYGPAYTVEYYKAYEAVLTCNHLQGANLSIVSIGCGAYIDKASAFYAVCDYNAMNNASIEMTYTGVDIANWGEDVIAGVPHKFIHKNMQILNPADFDVPINVLIFPKSLSEISQQTLDCFLQNMTPDCFQNKICIISSVSNSDGDFASSNRFCDDFCKVFSFRNIFNNRIQEIRHKTLNRCQAINEVYDFNFCSRAKEICNTIFEKCVYNRSTFQGCSHCHRTINRQPMLWSNYFNTLLSG